MGGNPATDPRPVTGPSGGVEGGHYTPAHLLYGVEGEKELFMMY